MPLNSDLAKRLKFKLDWALGLPGGSFSQITQIRKIRPLVSSESDNIADGAAKPEFWVPDFEISHFNRFSNQSSVGQSEGNRSVLTRRKNILVEGIGFELEPSVENPLALQAGRRSAIEQFFKERQFPMELTLYMFEGNFKNTQCYFDHVFEKEDLDRLPQLQRWREFLKKQTCSFDSLMINLSPSLSLLNSYQDEDQDLGQLKFDSKYRFIQTY